MENAKKFFEEIAKTEEAKAIFAATEKPETEEACIAAYVEVAKKLGVAITEEEVAAYLAGAAEADAELDDEELSQLVGGGDMADCKYSYQHKENCWLQDGCDKNWQDYDDYQCAGENLGYSPRLGDKIRANISKRYYPSCFSTNVNEQLKKNGFK